MPNPDFVVHAQSCDDDDDDLNEGSVQPAGLQKRRWTSADRQLEHAPKAASIQIEAGNSNNCTSTVRNTKQARTMDDIDADEVAGIVALVLA